MNSAWLRLAGELLGLASDQFSNHGCNEWEWPADWSAVERRQLAEAIVRDNVRKTNGEKLNTEEAGQVKHMASGKHGPPDWWVMAFLAGQLNPKG